MSIITTYNIYKYCINYPLKSYLINKRAKKYLDVNQVEIEQGLDEDGNLPEKPSYEISREEPGGKKRVKRI